MAGPGRGGAGMSPRRRGRRLLIERLESRAMLATVSALRSEFQVNSYTAGDQGVPLVAMDSAGDVVAVWQSKGQDGDGYGIYAQRYNSVGTALGSEFRVNTYTAGVQELPSVAMDSAGDFVIAWQSAGQDGNGYGIFAQRYNSSGTAQGSEFQVNSSTAGDQEIASVAMDSAGDFVVAWQSYGLDGSKNGIEAQLFLASGAAEGSQFQVNTYTTGNQANPSAAMDSAGDFVITWQSDGQDGSDYGVYAQRYGAGGATQGSEFRVNTYTAGAQKGASVAMDAAGDFVVIWSSKYQDGSGYGVYAQRYDSAGATEGSEFRVNSYTTGNQFSSGVAMDSTGDFVVTWQSYDQDGYGVYAEAYNASGTPQGSEFLVNTFTTGNQILASVAIDSSGDFAVAWQSAGEDGSGNGVYAQRYQLGPASSVLTINGTSASNVVDVTFTDASDFTVTLNGGTPTSYSTATYGGMTYNAPGSGTSELIFSDAFHTYSATQSFTSTALVNNDFNFTASGVQDLFIYASGNSTATVNVGSGADSNFYVDDLAASPAYSYIGNPATGAYSELSGFVSQAVTGSGSTTYAYVYSTSAASFSGSPTGSTFTAGGHTSTLNDFPQVYAVGAADGTDSMTLHSAGGEFVGTPQFSYVTGTSGGSTFLIGALYAASVTAQAAGSADTAIDYSYANDTFSGAASSSSLTGTTTNAGGANYTFNARANSYLSVAVFESGSGSDKANLTSSGGGTFIATTTVSTLSVGSSTITVDTYFENSSTPITAVPSQVSVTGANNGTDTASIYDAPGTNALAASGTNATLTNSIDTISVNKFGTVDAFDENGSSDTVHQAAIDYTLATIGNWTSA